MFESSRTGAIIAAVMTISMATLVMSRLPGPEQAEAPQVVEAPAPFETYTAPALPGAEPARVRVRSNPTARIFIDGVDRGKDTPYTLDVPPGKHKVQVRFKDGKRSQSREVTATSGGLSTLMFDINEKEAKVVEVTPEKPKKHAALKPARLVVIANFEKTDVTINGKPYPEYVEDGEEPGIVLPAGGPYQVNVKYDGKSKLHVIGLKPYERRVMIVEIPGFKGGGISAPKASPPVAKRDGPPPKPGKKKEEASDESGGRVTVYGKPRGTIIVDGSDKGKQTPNTVDVEQGRHEIQVKYEDGEISEKKIVRVRKGSRIKLFFRQRSKKK